MSNTRKDDWKNDTLKLKPVNSSAAAPHNPVTETQYESPVRNGVSGYTVALIVIATVIVCLSIVLALINNSSPTDSEPTGEKSEISEIDEPYEEDAEKDDEEPEYSDEKKEEDEKNDGDDADDKEPEDIADDESNPPENLPDEETSADEPADDSTAPNSPDVPVEVPYDDAPGDIPDISELE